MVGSEFGANSMNPWTNLPCVNCPSWWRWCNGVGNVFLAHFGLLIPINHRLNTTAYLSIVADHAHLFMTVSTDQLGQWES